MCQHWRMDHLHITRGLIGLVAALEALMLAAHIASRFPA